MLAFVIVTVFVAGLMVGRTPEYLGKKIEAKEMKMASLVILIVPLLVLIGSAAAAVCPAGTGGLANPGPHGFSEILYAFASTANNNGSAFAGLNANTPYYNLTTGLAMLSGGTGWRCRCWPSPARWRGRRSSPPAPARSPRTRRSSWRCSPESSDSSARSPSSRRWRWGPSRNFFR